MLTEVSGRGERLLASPEVALELTGGLGLVFHRMTFQTFFTFHDLSAKLTLKGLANFRVVSDSWGTFLVAFHRSAPEVKVSLHMLHLMSPGSPVSCLDKCRLISLDQLKPLPHSWHICGQMECTCFLCSFKSQRDLLWYKQSAIWHAATAVTCCLT
jgi:hypothetical protein